MSASPTNAGSRAVDGVAQRLGPHAAPLPALRHVGLDRVDRRIGGVERRRARREHPVHPLDRPEIDDEGDDERDGAPVVRPADRSRNAQRMPAPATTKRNDRQTPRIAAPRVGARLLREIVEHLRLARIAERRDDGVRERRISADRHQHREHERRRSPSRWRTSGLTRPASNALHADRREHRHRERRDVDDRARRAEIHRARHDRENELEERRVAAERPDQRDRCPCRPRTGGTTCCRVAPNAAPTSISTMTPK